MYVFKGGNEGVNKPDFQEFQHKFASPKKLDLSYTRKFVSRLRGGVGNLAHRIRVSWGPFFDSSTMGDTILRKLEQVVHNHMPF